MSIDTEENRLMNEYLDKHKYINRYKFDELDFVINPKCFFFYFEYL